jgi:hypothetical protein
MANQHPPLSTTTAIISPQYCAPGMNFVLVTIFTKWLLKALSKYIYLFVYEKCFIKLYPNILNKIKTYLVRCINIYILLVWKFSATHPIELIITKEKTLRDNFTVKDINDNVVLTVKSSLVTLVTPREHRFLFDANGTPILHLRRSVCSSTIY